MRERRRSRCVVLTMEVSPYLNVYSIMFEHKHSQIVFDNGIQTYIQENAVLLLWFYQKLPYLLCSLHFVRSTSLFMGVPFFGSLV